MALVLRGYHPTSRTNDEDEAHDELNLKRIPSAVNAIIGALRFSLTYPLEVG